MNSPNPKYGFQLKVLEQITVIPNYLYWRTFIGVHEFYIFDLYQLEKEKKFTLDIILRMEGVV